MKVHQIVSERTESLNEAVPLVIAGVGIGTIITLISAGMSAWSAYEIYKFIGKYNQDPESITDDEWNDLFIDAVLLFTPGFAKLGKAGIIKLIPKSWQSKGGKWLKKKVTERLAQLEKTTSRIEKINLKKFDPDSKAGWDKISAYLKMRGANSAMKAAAQAKMGFIPDVALTALKVAVGLNFVRDYYGDLVVLEQEYKDFTEGKPSGFDTMSEQEAYNKYQQLRRKLLGELTVGVALNMGVASKAFGFLNSALGGTVSAATKLGGGGFLQAKWFGEFIKIPGNFVTGLAKLIEGGVNAPAFLLFMQSKYSKDFLNNEVVKAITGSVGALTAGSIELLEKGLQAAGLLDGKLPGKTSATDPSASTPTGPTNSGLPIEWVGKKLFVSGQQISDENGYRIVGNNHISDIKADAAALKLPDPTLKLQDDPNRKYSMYGADRIK